MKARPAPTIRSMPRSNCSSATTPMSIMSRSSARARTRCMSRPGGADRRAGAVQPFTFTAGGAVVRNQLFLKFDGEGTVAGIRGATPAQGPPARRHHAGRRSHRARLPEPRSVQVRARRRGPRRVPGPHHRAAAGAEDRRQDDDAGAAAVRARRGRQQAGTGDLRRRRAMRPRRDRRRARRRAEILPDGARHSGRRRPRRC